MTEQRQSGFRRNDGLESLLTEINDLLHAAENQTMARFSRPSKPVLFVIGAPRSGTTMMMQWLARTDAFAYPTNLSSRFYAAPYLGSLISQLLLNPRFQHRDEFQELSPRVQEVASALGKTSGIHEPNEFWYFWRRVHASDVGGPLAPTCRPQVRYHGK